MKKPEINVTYPANTGLILTILFFVAKVAGYINWSWWLVFAPLWVPFVLVIAFMGLCLLFLIIAELMK